MMVVYESGEYAGCVVGDSPEEFYFQGQGAPSSTPVAVPLAPECQQAPPSQPQPSAPPLPNNYEGYEYIQVRFSVPPESAQAEAIPGRHTQIFIDNGYITQKMWDNLNVEDKATLERESRTYNNGYAFEENFHNTLPALKPYISFLTAMTDRMRELPEFSKKRMAFTQLNDTLENQLLCQIVTVPNKKFIITQFINQVKKFAAIHRDTGLKGVAMFTFLRKPQSVKLLNDIKNGRINPSR